MNNKPQSLLRRLHPSYGDPISALSRLSRHQHAASISVFIYYTLSVYVSYVLLLETHLNARSASAIFQWPVAWIGWLEWRDGPQFLTSALFIVAIACSLKTNSQTLRVVFAVLNLMVVGLSNSYGAINHGYHIWTWLALILCFAPRNLSNTATRSEKLGFLATITTAQLYILLTYSMAGTFKIIGGLKAAFILNESGNFSLSGPASQIADRSLQTGTEPFAADLVISHPALFAPLFWVLIFAQFFALLVIFKPRLHRTFGLIMIGFHFGTWALMEIIFPLHIAWQMLFFVFSPFRPDDNSDSPVQIAKEVFAKVTSSLNAGVRKVPTGMQPHTVK